nr:hypothetical protein P5652_22525 [Bacillus subtilis]
MKRVENSIENELIVDSEGELIQHENEQLSSESSTEEKKDQKESDSDETKKEKINFDDLLV